MSGFCKTILLKFGTKSILWPLIFYRKVLMTAFVYECLGRSANLMALKTNSFVVTNLQYEVLLTLDTKICCGTMVILVQVVLPAWGHPYITYAKIVFSTPPSSMHPYISLTPPPVNMYK
jgi:hypothetical protein